MNDKFFVARINQLTICLFMMTVRNAVFRMGLEEMEKENVLLRKMNADLLTTIEKVVDGATNMEAAFRELHPFVVNEDFL